MSNENPQNTALGSSNGRLLRVIPNIGGGGGIVSIDSSDGSVDIDRLGYSYDLSINYHTDGPEDRTMKISNTDHIISKDMQCVVIKLDFPFNNAANKYAKICECDLDVNGSDYLTTTLQLSFQLNGFGLNRGSGIFCLDTLNYISSSVQTQNAQGNWVLFDKGDNDSISLKKLYLYWKTDNNNNKQHYELWVEVNSSGPVGPLPVQAIINCSYRNSSSEATSNKQGRNIWRFNETGVETLTSSLPPNLTISGEWDPKDASISNKMAFFADVYSTTYSDIRSAYLAGRSVFARYDGSIYALIEFNNLYAAFGLMNGGEYTEYSCANDDHWTRMERYSIAKEYNIADFYTNTTYLKGDLRFEGASLWRCTYPITTPEDFDTQHWVSTKLDNEIDRVRDGGELTQAASITVANNAHYTMNVTNQNSITITVPVEAGHVPNFTIDIDITGSSTDVHVDVQKSVGGVVTQLNRAYDSETIKVGVGTVWRLQCLGDYFNTKKLIA